MNENPESPGDFDRIDQAILAELTFGNATLAELYDGVRAVVESTGLKNPDRVVDRRLLVLKNEGKILADGNSYSINPDVPVAEADVEADASADAAEADDTEQASSQETETTTAPDESSSEGDGAGDESKQED